MVDNYDSSTQAVISKEDENQAVDETVKIRRQVGRLKIGFALTILAFGGALASLAWFFYNSQEQLAQKVNLIESDRKNIEQIASVKQRVQTLEQKLSELTQQQGQLIKQVKAIQENQLPSFSQQLKQLDSNLNSLRQQRTEVVESKLKEINTQLQKMNNNVKKNSSKP
jgi:uncharacterized phage infection (PIP) family protein YhgE